MLLTRRMSKTPDSTNLLQFQTNVKVLDEEKSPMNSPKKRCVDNIMIKKKNEYVHSFTIHGLTRICTGSRAESIFWFTVLFLSIILGVVVVHGLISKYLKYLVYTEITARITTKNYFPSITFCDKTLMETSYFAVCGGKGFDHMHSNELCGNKSSPYPEKKIKLTEMEWNNGFFKVTQCNTWGNKHCMSHKYLQSAEKFNHHCFTWNYNGSFYDVYGHTDITFEVNKTSQIIAMIHDPRIKEPDPTQRYVLDPNRVYDLKLTKNLLRRLPAPFPSNCTTGKPNDIFLGKYTRKNCIESIAYIEILKKCGNIYDYHKRFIPNDIYNKYYNPNVTITELFQCLAQASATETKSEIEKCPFPCEELEIITMSVFNEREVHLEKRDQNKEVYRLAVQFQTIDSYKVIEEKQLYGWDQVLGEIGGLVGLVLGASVISLIEIVAFLFLCCAQRLCYIGQ